jgi:hypothetical protein
MPSSGIPLNTLPFLNNNRDTHSDVIFTDQPAIGRHTPIGDHDVEAGEDNEERANGHDDEEAELLNHQRHQHHRRCTRPSPITIKPTRHLQLYNLLERLNSSPAAVLVHMLVTALFTIEYVAQQDLDPASAAALAHHRAGHESLMMTSSGPCDPWNIDER